VSSLGGVLQPADLVADLGAGNGRLLQQIEARYGVDTVGVELNPGINARHLSTGRWFAGNLADVPWAETNPDVILLMPGRLLELDPATAETVRSACLRARQILVYAYADNLAPDGLAGLTARAGLTGQMLTLTDVPQHAVGLMAPPHVTSDEMSRSRWMAPPN